MWAILFPIYHVLFHSVYFLIDMLPLSIYHHNTRFICFRPEFIEFFGLNVTSSNGSTTITGTTPLSMNDDDDMAKGDDSMDDPSVQVNF